MARMPPARTAVPTLRRLPPRSPRLPGCGWDASGAIAVSTTSCGPWTAARRAGTRSPRPNRASWCLTARCSSLATTATRPWIPAVSAPCRWPTSRPWRARYGSRRIQARACDGGASARCWNRVAARRLLHEADVVDPDLEVVGLGHRGAGGEVGIDLDGHALEVSHVEVIARRLLPQVVAILLGVREEDHELLPGRVDLGVLVAGIIGHDRVEVGTCIAVAKFHQIGAAVLGIHGLAQAAHGV